MKVICKGHKTCLSIHCPHDTLHELNSCEWSKCVNIKSSDCYCSEDKQYTRKQKLIKLKKL